MKKLLFIPGYFGSTLIDRKTKELRWVRVPDFFQNKADLRMTESYSDLPPVHDVVEGDILLKVKLIPKILEIESYDKTLKHLQKLCDETSRELHVITYDWRDDFHASILKIAKKIDELTKDGQKIDIVAHSNGGILISYYLRYGIQDFNNASENWDGLNRIDKLSIVASPLRGAFSLFKHMKDGTTVLKNKRMMGSLDYTSFKSSYFFIPYKDWQKGYIGKKGNEFIDLNLYDVDVWKKNNWGPFIEKHQKEIPVNKEKFRELLKRAENFQNLVLAPVSLKPSSQIKLQVIQAYGRATYFYPTINDESNISQYHYPKFDREDGDGVVASLSAKPLDWFSLFDLDFKSIKAEHLKVISDYKYQKVIHEFLKN